MQTFVFGQTAPPDKLWINLELQCMGERGFSVTAG